MSQRQKFEITLNWEIEDDVFMPLTVRGVVTPWLPEMKPSLDQPGAPAEGRASISFIGDVMDRRKAAPSRVDVRRNIRAIRAMMSKHT